MKEVYVDGLAAKNGEMPVPLIAIEMRPGFFPSTVSNTAQKH